MIERIKKLKFYLFPLATCLGVAACGLLIIWGVLARSYGVSLLKKDFIKLINSLNAAGYDIAYDDIEFTPVSPFKIMKIENFKLYKGSQEDRWEWVIPEVLLNAGLVNYQNLTLKLSAEQTFKYNNEVRNITAEAPVIELRFNDYGFQLLSGDIRNIKIENLAEIESLRIGSQRMAPLQINKESPFLENYIGISNITLLTGNTWNLSPNIEELYLNANVMGTMEEMPNYKDSIIKWRNDGGFIEIKKLIVNWQPLVMVSRGSLRFDENFSPRLRLITTSKALIDTLDDLEAAKILDRKGVFVTKILLGNKAIKNSESEMYYTVVSPLTATPQEITIEGIPVWTGAAGSNKLSAD